MKTKSRICYTSVIDDEGGFTAGIVKEGETGYYKTDWHWKADRETADKLCDDMNTKLGISPKEAAEMVLVSMRSKK